MELLMEKHVEPNVEMKFCSCCQRMLPVTEFGKMGGKSKGLRNICKRCHNTSSNRRDIKGRLLKEANIMPQDELMNFLYNKDKEVDYTIDDLLEEIKSNGKKSIQSIQSSIKVHDDLLTDAENRNKIKVVLTNLIIELSEIV